MMTDADDTVDAFLREKNPSANVPVVHLIASGGIQEPE